MKRFISLLLVLVMVVSVLPVNALAAGTSCPWKGSYFTDDIYLSAAIDKALKVFPPKDGRGTTFNAGNKYKDPLTGKYVDYSDGTECYAYGDWFLYMLTGKDMPCYSIQNLGKPVSDKYTTQTRLAGVSATNFVKKYLPYLNPGTVIRLWDGDDSESGHTIVFLGKYKGYYRFVDCNWNNSNVGRNQVQYYSIPTNATYMRKGNTTDSVYNTVWYYVEPNMDAIRKDWYRSLTYLDKCTEYPSYLSLKITQPTTLKKYPCSASTDATSTNIHTPKIGEPFTSYALWKNSKGYYWYEVRYKGQTCYLYAGDAEWTNNGYWNDFSTSNIVAPTRLTQGESFYIGGTVSSKYNEITRVRAYVYKGDATSGTPVLSSSSELVGGKYYDLKNSKVDAGLSFSSLPAGKYTYVLKVYVDRNNCSRGTNFLRYYNTVKVYSKPFTVGKQVSSITAPTVSASSRASDGKPHITWNAVDGAVEYKVYRSTSKNGTYSLKYTTSGTNYYNTDATAGKTYYYKVRAINADGNYSAFSNRVVRTCDCAQPVVTASNEASTGKVKLSWKAVTGAKKYEVYRATSKNGTYTKLGTTSGTSFTNTSTVAGTCYYYKVRAIGSVSAATSAYSAVTYRTCDCAQPVVTASNVASSGKIKLTWSAVAGATKYEVYRATSKNGTYYKMFTTTGTSYINTSAVAGKTYYYKVRAFGAVSAATSAYSGYVYRTCDYAAPTVTASNNSYGKPRLTWKAVSGATKYEVAYSTNKTGTYYLLGTTSGTAYTNTSAVKGKTYYYKVRALGSVSAATSAYSTIVSRTCK